MKIAAIVPFWDPPRFRGGISRVVYELHGEWRKAGHQVDIFAYDGTFDPDQGVYQVRVPRMPLRGALGACSLALSGALKGYDIVFPQTATFSLFTDPLQRVPFLHTMSVVEARAGWRLWRRLHPAIERFALRKTRRCLVLDDTTEDALTCQYGMPAKNIVRVSNGVDATKFALPPTSEQREPVILCAGRFIKRKRFHLIMQGLAKLGPQYSDWRIVMAGDGPQKSELKQVARDLAIDQRVEFVGALSEYELISYYQKCSLFALPSNAEGMPMVVLEAMACGAPTILGDFATANILTDSSRLGSVVSGTASQDWAEALSSLISDRSKLGAMGVESRCFVQERYSWATIAAGIMSEFEAQVIEVS